MAQQQNRPGRGSRGKTARSESEASSTEKVEDVAADTAGTTSNSDRAGADDEPKVIEIRPMARRAKMRKRHWGLALSFFLIVVAPIALVGYYLFERATDQYASVAGFTVRQEEGPGGAEMLGGLSQFVGGTGSVETDMLYEYIRSQDLVAAVDDRLNLRGHYSAPHGTDPYFALEPGGTIEDLVDFWQRIVLVAYDQNSGLINLTVLAFDPEFAQKVADEILVESQMLVNELNANARSDSLKYAEEDLQKAVTRLKSAREALVRFRTRTQIVDPESDLRGRMGVLNSLQQQLAQAMIDYDIQAQDTGPEDPRVVQALRRIEVIRERIADERRTVSEDDANEGEEAYPALLAEYEGLMVDREFAEETYRVALAALDMARSNAARQSRYLSTYVRPTLPETAEFPRRIVILSLAGLFFLLVWTVLSLMYYAFRDRK